MGPVWQFGKLLRIVDTLNRMRMVQVSRVCIITAL
jgi:hypothetical protein